MDHWVDAGDDLAKQVPMEGKHSDDVEEHIAQGTTESLPKRMGDGGWGKDQMHGAGPLPWFSHEVSTLKLESLLTGLGYIQSLTINVFNSGSVVNCGLGISKQ